MRYGSLLVMVAVGAMLGAALPDRVAAHARLLRAEPVPGSTVKAAPKVVRAWFSEELDTRQSAISVWDSRGRRVDDGKGGVDLNDMDRRSMLARLKPLGPGIYTVRWKAVSADDRDATQGTFRFTVASP